MYVYETKKIAINKSDYISEKKSIRLPLFIFGYFPKCGQDVYVCLPFPGSQRGKVGSISICHMVSCSFSSSSPPPPIRPPPSLIAKPEKQK